MSLNLKKIFLNIALLAMANTGFASIETECGGATVTAEYSADKAVQEAEPPFGYWELDNHEVRVEKATLLNILNIREARISRAGLRPYGSRYLSARINALPDAQWPVDMATLVPPASAWDGVNIPEPISETYLKSEFYRLSMQRQEHSVILENALYHGVAEVRAIGGQSLGHTKRYSFEKRQKDGWMALGFVWVDPAGDRIYMSCRMEPINDPDT